MASTITLQNVIDYSRPNLRFLPLTIGVGNQPAIGIANIVKQTILGPPFAWRWNRAVASPFATVAGIQDYQRTITDFGFLEKASLTASGSTYEIPAKRTILGGTLEQSRPQFVSTQLDDNAGGITFRFMNAPDIAYSASLIYQKKATLFSALSDTWAPIPDELSFIYQKGFMAFAALYADDARWVPGMQVFVAALIGASEGIDETARDEFINSWLITMGQTVAKQQTISIGNQSRNSLR